MTTTVEATDTTAIKVCDAFLDEIDVAFATLMNEQAYGDYYKRDDISDIFLDLRQAAQAVRDRLSAN